jgi:hypothetical protein
MDADCVFAETYCGLRCNAVAALAAGTKIEMVTARDSPLAEAPFPVPAGTAGTAEPLVPPLHAATERQTNITANNRVNTASAQYARSDSPALRTFDRKCEDFS